MSCQQSQNFEEYTIEKEFDTYNKDQGKIDKIKIHITFTSDYLLIKWNSLESKAQMSLRNQIYLIIQIKFTIFHGKASIVKTKKNGQWNAFWNKQLLENVCGQKDLKQGLWKDLFKNYQSKAQIFEIGEYLNDFRIGRWNCICQYRKIGGGIYNKEGWKQGKWIEPDERIYDIKKVSYNGEYNMNNMKVGRWDIMYCKYDEKEYKQIIFKSTNVYSAGGSYDQEGNQRKVGKWVELDAGFYCFQYNSKQVTYNGEYNMNNMKVGRWDIMYCDRGGNGKYKQIGGESYDSEGNQYDQEGNQKKIGKWVELDEGFELFAQFIYIGEYNIKGQKMGIWVEVDIKENEKIGEQRYDD